jgi:CSLREA domain-containing protein
MRYRGQIHLLLPVLVLAACGEDQSPTAPTPPVEPDAPVLSHVPGHVVVNSLADPGNGVCNATQCTLREAINDPGSTRISFKSGLTGMITLARPGLGGGTLVLDKTLTITGPSGGIVIQRRSTDPAFRIVRIGVRDTVNLTNLTLRNGNTDSTGGGILNFGRLALSNCRVAGNSATQGGGGIDSHGWLELTNSSVANNSGGGISNDGRLTVAHSQVTGNRGSGIFNYGQFTLVNSLVADNRGSGIVNVGAMFRDLFAQITNSTIARNSTTDDGGGIANTYGGSLTITKSTIVGNSAANGGGISNEGRLRASASITITNSTVSGNSASYAGGGIYNRVGYEVPNYVSLTNSTVVHNSAEVGGGIYNDFESYTGLRNSLVAQNSASTGPDVSSEVYDASFSLIGDGSDSDLIDGVDGNQVGTASAPIDPKLGPLADNGGPTQTHRLLLGSPAIDAASSTDCPATDQRGVARPQGAGCDIGSFERIAP